MKSGERVNTSQGPGTVKYVRMGGDNFSEVVVVSVELDSRKDVWNYTGTIFVASQVKPL